MKSILCKKKRLTFSIVLILILSLVFNITSMASRNDKAAPSVPKNLRTVEITAITVSLTWTASKDNVGITAYDIYQNGSLAASTSLNTYTVRGLDPDTSYSFLVRARDASGNVSGTSNTIKVKTLPSEYTPDPPTTPVPTTAPTVAPSPTPVPTATPTPTPSPAPVPTAIPTPTPVTPVRVVGYYAGWSAYSGFTPEKIDAGKLTHIQYAFAVIGSDLKIALGDSYIDPSNFMKLNQLKQQNPHIKTLISVGGWNGSGKFSGAALTDASRTVFADSCVDFMVKHGFDGIDVDWEYPVSGGLAENIKRPEDKQNFTLLMKKLREKLDAQGAKDGKTYLLAFAGAAGSWYVNNVELNQLHQYLDYGSIMAYDIHGTWDKYTDFNAPLYNSTDVSPQYKWSVDSGVNAWLNTGFPAEKLIVGVPFYGYRYHSVSGMNNGLYQTYSGGSALSYASIAANYLNAAGYVRYFHQHSMVPWLFNGSTFISYEDEHSMGLKAQYIKDRQLGGAMIWELSQDPNRVLLDALYHGLK